MGSRRVIRHPSRGPRPQRSPIFEDPHTLPRLVLSSSALWGTSNEAWPSKEWDDMGQRVVPVQLQVLRMLFRSVTAVLSFLPCRWPTSWPTGALVPASMDNNSRLPVRYLCK